MRTTDITEKIFFLLPLYLCIHISMHLYLYIDMHMYIYAYVYILSFLDGASGKEPTSQETQVCSLGQEDLLEKGIAKHPSILA